MISWYEMHEILIYSKMVLNSEHGIWLCVSLLEEGIVNRGRGIRQQESKRPSFGIIGTYWENCRVTGLSRLSKYESLKMRKENGLFWLLYPQLQEGSLNIDYDKLMLVELIMENGWLERASTFNSTSFFC